MHTLASILTTIPVKQIHGDAATAVAGISIDSRKVVPGGLYIARVGTLQDGHDYIDQAIAAGATSIVCTSWPATLSPVVTYVQVEDAESAIGLMAAAFYGHASELMQVVGVTGTNGKTTVATLLYQLFTALGYTCGLISTVRHYVGSQSLPSTHTTPDAIGIQSLMAQMKAAGCTHVFMEVSSHAIHQQRIAGIHFTGGVFTNITLDHLDYHKTFDEYIRVKKLFFDNLPMLAFALANTDDKRGAVMLQNTVARKYSFSLRTPANFVARVLENNLTGLILHIGGIETHFRLVGNFNASNLLAASAVALLLGVESPDALAALSNVPGAEGRFQTVQSQSQKILGIIDYAHTPDALLNVLATIGGLKKGGQQLITVVGCGGDRDTSKRPLMAAAACQHSDRVILTSDNPRSEDPEQILNDMEADLSEADRRKKLRITDRREAINTACALANPGDIILVAGKGHETYQEIKGTRYPFDDVATLLNAFKTLDK